MVAGSGTPVDVLGANPLRLWDAAVVDVTVMLPLWNAVAVVFAISRKLALAGNIPPVEV
jgi:hypothetical protein